MSRAWLERARCAGEPTDLFFPDAHDLETVATAKAICAQCPVTAECLQYALDEGIDFGIWGGYGERGRRRYKRRTSICQECRQRFEFEAKPGYPPGFCSPACRKKNHSRKYAERNREAMRRRRAAKREPVS